MNVAAWARGQWRAVLFVLVVLATIGAGSLTRLPVLLFPRVSFPRVRVGLNAGDRPAERMLVEVTRPVEEAIHGIPGVRSIRSVTSRGSADVDVDFDWGHDMVSAALQVSAELSRIQPSLPSGASFDVRRMDPTVYPVIAYSLTSSTRSAVDLRNLALFQIRPALATVTGVGSVGVQGGATEEWRVVVDPGKLRAFGLAISDVAKAVSASNILTAVGRMQQDDKLYLVLSDTRFKSLSEVEQAIIRSGADGVVRVEDVAEVRPDVKPQYIRVTAGGHNAVLFSIYQQPGGNTVQIAKGVKAKLKALQSRIGELHDGTVKVANWYDQSSIILKSEGSVRDAIAVGVVLAAIVLFVFLRNWKITLIATLAVPVVLAVTVLGLYLLHMSLNIMTLGGMAAAVGLIIDDAIVMVEHVMRRIRAGTEEHGARVVKAAGEFTKPLAGSSLSTIIIFAPLALLSGVTGAFFKALSLTMAAGLLVSFLVAWLIIPVVSAQTLGESDARENHQWRWAEGLAGVYNRRAGALLARPWLVLVLIAPIAIVGWLAFGHVKSGFMPSMDEGGFILDYNAPPGTSLTETDRELRQVEAILSANPAVDTYSRRTGLQLGGGVTEANQGDFFVRLKPSKRPPITQVMDDVRQKVEHEVPALKIETSQLMEDLIGDLTGVPEPIDIRLFSPDEPSLLETAPKVAAAIGKVNGVVEVKSGVVVAGDSLDIQVDRVKAALEGVDPKSVTQALDDYLGGTVTTQIQQGEQLVGVRVWSPSNIRASIEDIGELRMRAPDGHMFPMERVASVRVVTGNPQIDRQDLRRTVAVTGRISGRDLGSTMADVQKVLGRSGLLPKAMTYTLGGTYEQQRSSFQGLMMVMIAALVLIFTLVLFLFRQFVAALAMLTVVLLEVAWIFIVLWVTGTELDIMSIMGMTMIVGIVTEVSIFYYTEFADLPQDTPLAGRLMTAARQRTRAIAMTTIAAILALIMLALGIGEGAAMLQPLAIAIIGGLVAQAPFVLLILPALLVLFTQAVDTVRARFARRRRG